MQNQWLVPGRLSGLKPPYVDADDPSLLPPAPPDPPDSTSPFSPQNFPPLASPQPTPLAQLSLLLFVKGQKINPKLLMALWSQLKPCFLPLSQPLKYQFVMSQETLTLDLRKVLFMLLEPFKTLKKITQPFLAKTHHS